MGVARFNGSALWLPGTTRFVDGWVGQAFDYPGGGIGSNQDFQANGVLGRGVVQTGRLVVASAALLQAKVGQLASIAEALTEGTLDAGDGRVWNGITMLRIRFKSPVSKGRVWSVAYTIDYAVLP